MTTTPQRTTPTPTSASAKPRPRTLRRAMAVVFAVAATLPAVAVAQNTPEAPLPQETQPLGDIPDSQVFVSFHDALGFVVKVPEGWARTGQQEHVHFQDKYNEVDLRASSTQSDPATVAQAQATLVSELMSEARAVQVSKVERVTLPAGPAIRINYTSNSDPNGVTGKQIRLENERYVLVYGGTQVELSFSAPQGADNVDAWNLMSQSFRWG